jgi:hypothetical protein
MDIYLSLKKAFTEEEIKKLTTLQVNLYHQRIAEPVWKQEIDQSIRDKNNG